MVLLSRVWAGKPSNHGNTWPLIKCRVDLATWHVPQLRIIATSRQTHHAPAGTTPTTGVRRHCRTRARSRPRGLSKHKHMRGNELTLQCFRCRGPCASWPRAVSEACAAQSCVAAPANFCCPGPLCSSNAPLLHSQDSKHSNCTLWCCSGAHGPRPQRG
jgi:hypothetical protein